MSKPRFLKRSLVQCFKLLLKNATLGYIEKKKINRMGLKTRLKPCNTQTQLQPYKTRLQRWWSCVCVKRNSTRL